MQDDKAFLPYFIEEPIYVLNEDKQQDESLLQQDVQEAAALEEHIETEPTKVEELREKVDLKPIVTFGENLKHCIVLFESAQKISPESKDLLFKILAAIKRTPKDALMANVYDCSKEQVEALLSENNHKHLISFGVKQAESISQLEAYVPTEAKGKHYILSDGLEAVAIDKDKKRALWQALQEVFH